MIFIIGISSGGFCYCQKLPDDNTMLLKVKYKFAKIFLLLPEILKNSDYILKNWQRYN